VCVPSVSVEVKPEQVVLSYQVGNWATKLSERNARVGRLASAPAIMVERSRLGLLFNADCHRRVAVLYLDGLDSCAASALR